MLSKRSPIQTIGFAISTPRRARPRWGSPDRTARRRPASADRRPDAAGFASNGVEVAAPIVRGWLGWPPQLGDLGNVGGGIVRRGELDLDHDRYAQRVLYQAVALGIFQGSFELFDAAVDLDIELEHDRCEHRAFGRLLDGAADPRLPGLDVEPIAGGERFERGQHAQAER